MRKSVFCCILTMVLVASLASCRGWFEPAPDRELFGDYEPLEWKDSYIFAATNYYPPQVQVWDTADGEVKFVRSYNLWVDKRDLTIWDLAVLDKILWITAHGMQFNLIRVDLETGKTRFLDLDMTPHFVQAVPEGNGDRRCLVVSDYCHVREETAVCFINTDGEVIKRLSLPQKLYINTPSDVVYQAGGYFLTGMSEKEYDLSNPPVATDFQILNYNASGQYASSLQGAIPTQTPAILEYIQKDASQAEVSYRVTFNTHLPGHPNAPVFVECGIITMGVSDFGRRFLLKCNSFNPPQFEYMGIFQPAARSIHSATQGGEKIFLTGRTLDINYSDLNGLETGVYPASGGSQLKRIEMPDGNQLHCTELPECTWFSCNVWGTDKYGDFVDKGTIPRIYRLDYATESVTCYWADGRVEKMRELPG